MYTAILTKAGYTKHSECFGTACWIKTNYPDINYDTATGLWASEDDCSGQTAISLEGYLTFMTGVSFDT